MTGWFRAHGMKSHWFRPFSARAVISLCGKIVLKKGLEESMGPECYHCQLQQRGLSGSAVRTA